MDRAARLLLLFFALATGWLFADLYLRIELPLAATAIHLAFRTAAACVAWLQEGDGSRPLLLAGGLATVAVVAAIPGRWTAPLRSLGGLPLAAAQLALLAGPAGPAKQRICPDRTGCTTNFGLMNPLSIINPT